MTLRAIKILLLSQCLFIGVTATWNLTDFLSPRSQFRDPLEFSTPREGTVGEGPWVQFLSNPEVLKDRMVMFGFIRSLFVEYVPLRFVMSLDYARQYPRSFYGLPKAGIPDRQGFNRVIDQLREIWRENYLDQQHGSLDFWLAQATLADLDPSLVMENAERLCQVRNPLWALSYSILFLSRHLHQHGPHPDEIPGKGTRFIDNEILIDQLPILMEQLISAEERNDSQLQDIVMEREVSIYDPLTQRTLLLWVIASALDPAIYPGRKFLKERFLTHVKPGSRYQLISKFKSLVNSDTHERIPVTSVISILQEILETDWSRYGLRPPWELKVRELSVPILLSYPDSIVTLKGSVDVSTPTIPGFLATLHIPGRFEDPFLRIIEADSKRKTSSERARSFRFFSTLKRDSRTLQHSAIKKMPDDTHVLEREI